MPLEIRSNEYDGQTHVKAAVTRGVETVALAAALVTLWSLTHRYGGLSGDGELYAIQALARTLPTLGNDIFLRSTSQDNYTVFSPIYALLIGWVGIRTAAITLTVVVKLWFYSAAWALVRAFVNQRQAFLGAALLIVIKGAYGPYNVFKYSEDFLTARSVAEALVVTALALHYRGYKLTGLLVVVAALFIHPLMALPGLLLLFCVRMPLKWRVLGAAGGALVALGIACYGSMTAPRVGIFAILDPPWLEVVRERSQFLFLQLWSRNDWTMNSRPFVSLVITLLASREAQIKRLCWASLLVGFTGLAIAFIAGAIGPVAILLQGQAWRWLWIPAFMSVALLIPTVINLWRDENCGPLCALLLVLGWTFSAVNSLECLIPALLLWSARGSLRTEVARYVRWAALCLAIIIILWILGTSWDALTSPAIETGRETLALARTRNILGLQVSSVLLVWLIYKWVGWNGSAVAMLLCCTTFVATAAISLPGTFFQPSRDGTISEINEFLDWRAAIPPDSNVYVVPAHNSAAFAWFTLERPSYLSVDQSAGVVFSRETALEVKRRSQVLLPLTPPDWKLLTAIEERHHGVVKDDSSKLQITREILVAICSDSQLGFVVAKPDVGFAPIKHTHAGNWRDWNLYDCSRVRSTVTVAGT
jgi:hypothetical protein